MDNATMTEAYLNGAFIGLIVGGIIVIIFAITQCVSATVSMIRQIDMKAAVKSFARIML